MNLHVPQGCRARAEAKYLCGVKYNIVSAQSNQPVMSIIQDSMYGAYLITQEGVRISKSNYFHCIMDMPGFTGELKFGVKDFYSGHELISEALPMVNYEGCGCRIRQGVLEYGQLTKGVLGTSHGSLIHVINNDCGPTQVVLFMHRLQRLSHQYLQIVGFTMGVSDILCPLETSKFVHDQCREAFENVKFETDEMKINTILNGARDSVGKAVQQHLNQNNNLFCMVNSGAKGKKSNISQILGVVGQQNLAGKRMPKNWKGRTLTHFKVGDNSPQSRGFIESSYVEGLKPWEVWFHAIAGREGIIDTAIKTARTGYIQRRFIKALENLNTELDGSVRNADGSIIQFLYGEDKLCGKSIEKQKLYEMEELDKTKVSSIELQLLVDAENFLKEINSIREPIYRGTPYWMLPCAIDRIILNSQTIFNLNIGKKLSQKEIFKQVSNSLEKIDNVLIKNFFRIKLNSFKLFYQKKVTSEHLDRILFEMLNRLELALIPQGSSVGSLSAQSVGEYLTQMTLNTFHSAGNSAMNVTLGIPRLMELIDVVKKIKTPMTSFYCDNPQDIYERMKVVYFKDVVDTYIVTETPNEHEVEDFYDFPDADFKKSDIQPTLVLYLKDGADISTVKQVILDSNKNMSIAYNENGIFHVRYTKKEKKTLAYFYEQVLKKKIIQGIAGAGVVEILQDGDKTKIQTSLTDLREIWALGVGYNTVIVTNDVDSILQILGIEAARTKILNEIRDILGYYGLYVNARHLNLLVEWMAFSGKLLALTRHGIKDVDSSPLKLATFEEIIRVFTESAMLKKEDPLDGISENIVVGGPPKIGPEKVGIVNDYSVFEKFKQDVPDEEEESMWDNFASDDDEDDPWLQDMSEPQPVGGDDKFIPVLNQPQFHLNQMMGPPVGLSHNFQRQTRQQLVDSSSVQVNLFHGSESPVAVPYSPVSPAYSPTSPAYSPLSPVYSPTSPMYDDEGTSQAPAYDPTQRIPVKKRKTFF